MGMVPISTKLVAKVRALSLIAVVLGLALFFGAHPEPQEKGLCPHGCER
jgi:hypothetical protein